MFLLSVRSPSTCVFTCWRSETFVPPPLTEGGAINEEPTRRIKGTSLGICLANTKASSARLQR